MRPLHYCRGFRQGTAVPNGLAAHEALKPKVETVEVWIRPRLGQTTEGSKHNFAGSQAIIETDLVVPFAGSFFSASHLLSTPLAVSPHPERDGAQPLYAAHVRPRSASSLAPLSCSISRRQPLPWVSAPFPWILKSRRIHNPVSNLHP